AWRQARVGAKTPPPNPDDLPPRLVHAVGLQSASHRIPAVRSAASDPGAARTAFLKQGVWGLEASINKARRAECNRERKKMTGRPVRLLTAAAFAAAASLMSVSAASATCCGIAYSAPVAYAPPVYVPPVTYAVSSCGCASSCCGGGLFGG